MPRSIRSAAASAPIAATRSRCRPSSTQSAGDVQTVTAQTEADEGRAYHSSYFEMLGEQGFPGLILFLLIHGIGLVRMEVIRRRYRKAEGDEAWIAPLATALQHFQLIYLVGSLFVGIAYQPLRLADDRGRHRLRRLSRAPPAGRDETSPIGNAVPAAF